MSISSLNGQWGMGPQTAKGAVATTFYRYRALRVGGGAVTLTEQMPPEIGGVPLPDGAHKLGTYYAGVADMIPRLEGDFGWLLYAACGAVSSVSDVPEAGLYTHIFRMDTSDYLALKWMTVRRIIPGPAGGANSGEAALDTRIAGVMLNFAANARLTARVQTLGRVPSSSDDVSLWDWVDDPEGPTSIPTSVNESGYFKIPDFQAGGLPTQLVRVTLGNTVTQPQQEFVIGSPYPEDFTALYRNVAIDVDYKWEDEDLYLQLIANGATGASIAWSPVVFEGDFAVKLASPANITGQNYPYSLEVTAERVFWFPAAPPEIAGLNILRLPIRGIVGRPSSGEAFTIRIVNEIPSYSWPG